MVRRADPARDLQSQQAAYLRGRHHMSQDEIARILHVSQPQVSRLLARAEQMGWLATEVRFVEDDLCEEVMIELQRLHALEGRARCSGKRMPNVRVFGGGSDAAEPMALKRRYQRFGRAAAGRLQELFGGVELVGIAWGGTLSSLIEGLAALRPRPRLEHTIGFVPLCAELVSLTEPEGSSSRLAHRLNQIVNEGAAEQLRLAGVPAYIPRHYTKEKARVIWEYVFDNDAYRRIFGGPRSLVERIDLLLTSVGSTEKVVSGFAAELLEAGDIDAERLRSLVIGDIGGALIPKLSLDRADRQLVDELNWMWTGIGLHHIERLAHQAAATDRPGITVVAVGRDKAPVLLELIRLELVNELIIDQDLSRALERLLYDEPDGSVW